MELCVRSAKCLNSLDHLTCQLFVQACGGLWGERRDQAGFDAAGHRCLRKDDDDGPHPVIVNFLKEFDWK